MMSKCWDVSPSKRPTFKEIHSRISVYIGCIGDYIEMNPFTGGSVGGGGECGGEGTGETVQVVPPAVDTPSNTLYANV